MKRNILIMSILLFLLVACKTTGSVTPPGQNLPQNYGPALNTAVVINTEVPLVTEVPRVTEEPGLGSSRISASDGTTLVFVPGGGFQMGSESSSYANERPVHAVYLDPYWIEQTEVTNAMFETFVGQTGYQTDAEKKGSSNGYNPDTSKSEVTQGADWKHPFGPDSNLSDIADHPAVHVSWNDAFAYCQWAGRRLPTEAEWEKAARGTDAMIFPWGNDFNGANLNSADAKLNAFWGNNNIDDGFQYTSPVGTYPSGASPYGALDMSGNVWEWVNDFVDEAYYQSSPSSNPGGPTTGEYRIVRGGSWHDPEDGQRTAYRGWTAPDDSDITLGFRCAISN